MPDLIKPTIEDLSVRKEMIEDKKTMAFYHSIIPFPKTEWQNWYANWISANPKERYYRFAWCPGCEDYVALCGWKKVDDVYQLILIVDYKRRKTGYGSQLLKQLAEAGLKTGIQEFYVTVYDDNPAIPWLKEKTFQEQSRFEDQITMKASLQDLLSN